MVEHSDAGEKLLDAWLSLSSTLWNTRLVKSMTYNEAHVMGLLLRGSSQKNPLTATDLIRRTGLLKSQMNKILTTLEKRGHIVRTRAEQDKRMLYVRLSEEGVRFYAEHFKSVRALLDQLVERIGADCALSIAGNLNDLIEALDGLIPQPGRKPQTDM